MKTLIAIGNTLVTPTKKMTENTLQLLRFWFISSVSLISLIISAGCNVNIAVTDNINATNQ